MTTKQLKDIIDAPPVHRTPFFLPLCQLACEIAGFGDDLNAPADEGSRPLNFDYNIVDEIRVQAHRVRTALTPALKSSKKSATDPQ